MEKPWCGHCPFCSLGCERLDTSFPVPHVSKPLPHLKRPFAQPSSFPSHPPEPAGSPQPLTVLCLPQEPQYPRLAPVEALSSRFPSSCPHLGLIFHASHDLHVSALVQAAPSCVWVWDVDPHPVPCHQSTEHGSGDSQWRPGNRKTPQPAPPHTHQATLSQALPQP